MGKERDTYPYDLGRGNMHPDVHESSAVGTEQRDLAGESYCGTDLLDMQSSQK